MTYDLIIIGGGPAGSAAAVYASRKRLQTLFITSEWGGQSVVSEKIYNWIGTPSLSGNELADNFKKHVLANATGKMTSSTLEVKEGEKVTNVAEALLPQNSESKASAKSFSVKTELDEEFLTKTVLITSGSGRRKLEAKNADRLEHKGLTYCASCDGPLFADMDVAVIGGGNAAFESAAQLLAYCKSVTLLNRSDRFRADEITVKKVLSHPNMKVLNNSEIIEVQGGKFVDGLYYRNKITGERDRLKVSGIFVEIGLIPTTDFAKNIIKLNEIGQIPTDPRTQQTSILGIWAAGDCTDGLYHQNNIASGDAVKALEDIYI